jgi:hypothetical protein
MRWNPANSRNETESRRNPLHLSPPSPTPAAPPRRTPPEFFLPLSLADNINKCTFASNKQTAQSKKKVRARAKSQKETNATPPPNKKIAVVRKTKYSQTKFKHV